MEINKLKGKFFANEESRLRYCRKHNIEINEVIGDKIADIIIPHHDRHDLLNTLLKGINSERYNIIIVSGGSFAENCNKGAKIAETDNLIFMNDDVEITDKQLYEFTEAIKNDNLVGSTQIANGRFIKGIILYQDEEDNIRPLLDKDDALIPSGFLLGIEKSNWEKLNGFDTRFINGSEDVDLGLRALESGLRVDIVDLKVKHKESQSTGRFDKCKENEALLCSIWSNREIARNNIIDEYYNYNKTFKKRTGKKKVLLACQSMEDLTGSPLYNYTLAMELVKDYNVSMFSLWSNNYLKKDLLKVGVKIVDDTDSDYDLIIVSQGNLPTLKGRKFNGKVINIVHSEYIYEAPLKDAYKWVAIRPSIKEHLIKNHNIPENKIEVIYNGINLDRFKPIKKSNRDYTKVVIPASIDNLRKKFFKYYTDKANKDFRVYIYGMDGGGKIKDKKYVYVKDQTSDIEKHIAEADIVAGILLGRVNLEARACDVLSYIHNPDKPEEYETFYPLREDFEERHNIKNVAKLIMNL